MDHSLSSILSDHSKKALFKSHLHILILDTIHGGIPLGEALSAQGHSVEYVDVYRGDLSIPGSITPDEALLRKYDLLIYPVHLDPAHPILRSLFCPSINHHQAVRWILGEKAQKCRRFESQIVEISGARGKTTTATALAFILEGFGILHTSRGTFRYPNGDLIRKMSITPSSLISVFSQLTDSGWLIGEISLGFTGISDLAILTSADDYHIAGGRLSAWECKKKSSWYCQQILVPPDVSTGHDTEINAGDLVTIVGTRCQYSYKDLSGEFSNPLFLLDGYKVPLQLACAAALILGKKPDKLQDFLAIPGRLQILKDENGLIIDNANSGASLRSTREAISILRQLNCNKPFSLVIGQEERSVCDNFPTDDIIAVIREGKPSKVFLIAGDDRIDTAAIQSYCSKSEIPLTVVQDMVEGTDIARNVKNFAIVIAVKTWR